jgi:hypothetical protein
MEFCFEKKHLYYKFGYPKQFEMKALSQLTIEHKLQAVILLIIFFLVIFNYMK